jgi:PRTRC genetic system protein B
MLCWWSPAQSRQMFYENREGKAAVLNGRVLPQPPPIWRVADGELMVRALVENKRPSASTQPAVAPFWNLSEGGQVCMGSMYRPAGASVSNIPEWEKGFYESAFTHANIGRITRHAGGFEGLWSSVADKRKAFRWIRSLSCPRHSRSSCAMRGTEMRIERSLSERFPGRRAVEY